MGTEGPVFNGLATDSQYDSLGCDTRNTRDFPLCFKL